MIFLQENKALIAKRAGETLRIEPWGPDALRVRAFMYDDASSRDWALTEIPAASDSRITIGEEDFWVGDGTISKTPCAEIVNGRIRATVNFAGVLSFYRDGSLILR